MDPAVLRMCLRGQRLLVRRLRVRRLRGRRSLMCGGGEIQALRHVWGAERDDDVGVQLLAMSSLVQAQLRGEVLVTCSLCAVGSQEEALYGRLSRSSPLSLVSCTRVL